MRDWLAGIVAGFGLGLLVSLGVDWYRDPTFDDMQRTYDAYRACIQTSRCIMTAQDYIEYYNLKWELEEKQ